MPLVMINKESDTMKTVRNRIKEAVCESVL